MPVRSPTECRFCAEKGTHDNPVNLLPSELLDPQLPGCACTRCAIERGYFCPMHSDMRTPNMPCSGCVHMAVEREKVNLPHYVLLLQEGLTSEEWQEVADLEPHDDVDPDERTVLLLNIVYASFVQHCSPADIVSRTIATRGERLFLDRPLPPALASG